MAVSFGRRLALFFLLIVIVPMAGLLAILFLVSEDSRRGKADARLSAGLETAIALYRSDSADGRAAARGLATTPGFAGEVSAASRARLQDTARAEVKGGKAVAVQVLDAHGNELAAFGPPSAIAFGEVAIAAGPTEIGSVRASTATAAGYANEVRRLTNRELVVSRQAAPLASTVTPPRALPEPGGTVDLKLEQGDYRAREQLLDAGSKESVLLLGPRKEGGILAVGRPAIALLAVFLILAALLAYNLARRLNALHGQVASQAVTDPLTGLWNRRRLGELLTREAEREQRFGRPFSLLIVDIDDFKSINDRHGHPTGDEVLRELARVIERETRSLDEAVRYGGDELALILAETGMEGAAILAERLRERTARTSVPLRDGGGLTVSLSIGVATLPESAPDPEGLVEAADQALLEAKRAGKDRVVSAPPASTPKRGRAGRARP
jgi:diguanylate cyclase (GGDEF)-like protein